MLTGNEVVVVVGVASRRRPFSVTSRRSATAVVRAPTAHQRRADAVLIVMIFQLAEPQICVRGGCVCVCVSAGVCVPTGHSFLDPMDLKLEAGF